MGKYKYLLKNIGLLTLGQFGTKLLSFFLVPLYTNILSTGEYGTYDLFSTTTSLLIPVLTLNAGEAIAVFALDKNYKNKGSILSVGLKFSIIGSILVTVLTAIFVLINGVFDLVQLFNEFWFFLPLMFFLSVLSSVMTNFARGIEKVKEIAVGGVLCTLAMISFNILFLVVIEWGLLGYFLAFNIGLFVQIIYMGVSCKIWNFIKFSKDVKLEREMLSYSKPLIANSICWWVNNSSDKYVVTAMQGITENGIYSVGYKIPSILNIVQSIFAQAWSISAIKEFDPEDSNGFFSTMYTMYNYVLTASCSAIIVLGKLMAFFLYAKDFYSAWKYVPFLTISIIFGALAGFLGGFFAAVKDSKTFAKSTIISAVVNTVLNFVFIYFIGTIGAAIATVICYFLVWIIRYVEVKKYIKLKINIFRDAICYFILVLQSLVMLFIETPAILYPIESLCFLLIIFMFRGENKMLIVKTCEALYKRKKLDVKE